MKFGAKWYCPHCGFENSSHTEGYSFDIKCCDSENGGCGQYVAVMMRVTATATAHRIEGVSSDLRAGPVSA